MLYAYLLSALTAITGILLIGLTYVAKEWNEANVTADVSLLGIMLTMVGLCSFGLARGIDQGVAVILKRIDNTKASSASDQAGQSAQGK